METKSLKDQLIELQAEKDSVEATILEKKSQITSLQNKLNDLKNRVTNLQNQFQVVQISDHAIVRYFERILGYDLKKVREAILPSQTEEEIRVRGKGYFAVAKSHDLVARERVVVTLQNQQKRTIGIGFYEDEE